MKVKANFPTQEELIAVLEAAESSLDNPGFCLACGEQADGCEPDARGYTCESCGDKEVYGAQEVLLMGAYRG
jgi:hypothetical protein